MTFAEHITTNVFLPRLNDRRILVVYDEHKRFEGICRNRGQVSHLHITGRVILKC